MANVRSYKRRVNGKTVTVGGYDRNNPKGNGGFPYKALQSAPDPLKNNTGSGSSKKATPKASSLPSSLVDTQFLGKRDDESIRKSLEQLTEKVEKIGVVVFPTEEQRQSAIRFMLSKGILRVRGLSISKLFVLPKDEGKAKAALYKALRTNPKK